MYICTILCKENFANIRNLIASIRESVMNIHEQFMNVCNALFHELNNFRALYSSGIANTHVFYISNYEIGYEHSTSTNVDHEHSQFGS